MALLIFGNSSVSFYLKVKREESFLYIRDSKVKLKNLSMPTNSKKDMEVNYPTSLSFGLPKAPTNNLMYK